MAARHKKFKEIGRSQSMPSSSQRRETKSATLPANLRPLPTSSGEGFFTKLKRCLRLGSRGRYNVNTMQTESLSREVESQKPEKPRNVVSRATSLRLYRRDHKDKEDVVLIHKGKMASGAGIFSCRVEDTIHEDSEQTVVQILNGDASKYKEQAAGGTSASTDLDDVFDGELDPGYETLDEIRKKVKLHAEAVLKRSQNSPPVDNSDLSQGKEQSKSNCSNSDNPINSGQDSGITTPTTESPESSRESQGRSMTSSMFSDTVLTEGSNQVDVGNLDDLNVFGMLQRLNSCPTDNMSKPYKDGQRYSSDSFLTTGLQHDTDTDLYANPQILFRKQSRMGQNKNVSASTSTIPVNSDQNTLTVPTFMGEKSMSEGDVGPGRGSSVESDAVAPPLPDRHYLDSDVYTSVGGTDDEHSGDNDCSTSTTISANCDLTHSATHDSVASINSIREVLREESSTPNAENLPVTDLMNTSRKITDTSKCALPETAYGSVESVNEKSEYNCNCEDNRERILNDNVSLESSQKSASLPSFDNTFGTSTLTSGPEIKLLTHRVHSDGNLKTKENLTVGVTKEDLPKKSEVLYCERVDSEAEVTFLDELTVKQSLNQFVSEACSYSAQNDILSGETGSAPQDRTLFESLNEDMNSIEVVERRGENIGTFDPNSAQNVVVIKLHESAHEDCLLETSFSEEGVSDKTIARLEEKAVLLKMGAQKQTSSADDSKETENLQCENEVQTSSNSQAGDVADMSELGATSAPLPDASSTSESKSSGFKKKSRSKPKREINEPIHMSFAEVMEAKVTEHDGSSEEEEEESDADSADSFNEYEDAGEVKQTGTALYPAAAAQQAFLESMRQLKDCGWYWGPLSYTEAVSKLMNKPDGSFLVRDSSSENYILSLSFKCTGCVCHTRIEHNRGVFSFWSQPDSHGKRTIKEFIEQAVQFSHTGKFLYFLRPSGPGSPPIAIRLLYPVSRFCRVPSLQHMCRFLILRKVRRDHIDVLPVPEKVKDYLRENQYYVETLED